MLIIIDASNPKSTHRKKSNSICHHLVQKDGAMGKAIVAHIPITIRTWLTCSRRCCMLYGQSYWFLVDRFCGMCSPKVVHRGPSCRDVANDWPLQQGHLGTEVGCVRLCSCCILIYIVLMSDHDILEGTDKIWRNRGCILEAKCVRFLLGHVHFDRWQHLLWKNMEFHDNVSRIWKIFWPQ